MTGDLDHKQRAELARELGERRFALRRIIAEELLQADGEAFRELAGEVHDEADESVADLLADLNLAVIDHHIRELRLIEAALGHLGDASFGSCTSCGAPIEYDRLRAQPSATRCHRCQQRYELDHTRLEHSSL